MRFIGGKDKIVGLVLLQHQPHAFHIIACKSPVPLRIHIAQRQLFLIACHNVGDGKGDFSCHKVLASSGRLMVKQNAVAGKHIVRFPVIYRNPVGI